MNKTSTVRGFTLLELIVVIAIIGVLSVIIIPTFRSALSKANDTKLKQNVTNTLKKYTPLNKWEFEEGSGSVAKDTAINLIDNTLQNNANFSYGSPVYSPDTYSSSSQSSIYFNGSSYLQTVNSTYPKLDGQSFSFSIWFKRTGGWGDVDKFLFTKGYWGGNGVCRLFHTTFRYDSLYIGFASADADTGVKVTDQNWHNLMMSFDVSTSKLVVYLDGSRLGSYTMPCSLSGTDSYPFLIGGWSEGPGYFIGNLDDVYYFKDIIVR